MTHPFSADPTPAMALEVVLGTVVAAPDTVIALRRLWVGVWTPAGDELADAALGKEILGDYPSVVIIEHAYPALADMLAKRSEAELRLDCHGLRHVPADDEQRLYRLTLGELRYQGTVPTGSTGSMRSYLASTTDVPILKVSPHSR